MGTFKYVDLERANVRVVEASKAFDVNGQDVYLDPYVLFEKAKACKAFSVGESLTYFVYDDKSQYRAMLKDMDQVDAYTKLCLQYTADLITKRLAYYHDLGSSMIRVLVGDSPIVYMHEGVEYRAALVIEVMDCGSGWYPIACMDYQDEELDYHEPCFNHHLRVLEKEQESMYGINIYSLFTAEAEYELGQIVDWLVIECNLN